MKTFVQFYLVVPAIFMILTSLQLEGDTINQHAIALLGAASVGLFAGFVLNMAVLIGKKIKKQTPGN
jgi:peptidoglycan/LPS O-acetylase OafA/YrhL